MHYDLKLSSKMNKTLFELNKTIVSCFKLLDPLYAYGRNRRQITVLSRILIYNLVNKDINHLELYRSFKSTIELIVALKL